MAGYEHITLEKGMYSVPGKSFTQVLEELDRSEQYRGTPLEGLDAFQRQLKRFDIKVSGPGSDPVERFFATSAGAALFPEYVSRAVRQGMERVSQVNDLVATVTRIDGMDYRTIDAEDETCSPAPMRPCASRSWTCSPWHWARLARALPQPSWRTRWTCSSTATAARTASLLPPVRP